MNEMYNVVTTSKILHFHVCPRGGTVLKAVVVDPARARELRFIETYSEFSQPSLELFRVAVVKNIYYLFWGLFWWEFNGFN